MKVTDVEYLPLIEYENHDKKYYAIFFDVKNNFNKIEITKNIFLQIFGVHKTIVIDERKYYFIEYRDNSNICIRELTLKEFKKFNSFQSQNIKNKNIYNRYIEHLEQTEFDLYKKMLYQPVKIEDLVFKKLLLDQIYNAMSQLNEIQRRRFIMYYIDEMTYEQIAKIEGCTKRAIKFSVDAARKNLQKMLKNLYLDYTNR